MKQKIVKWLVSCLQKEHDALSLRIQILKARVDLRHSDAPSDRG